MAKHIPYFDLFDKDYDRTVGEKDNRPKLVVFNVSWSGSGQMLDDIVSELSATHQSECDFFRVDADKNPNLISRLGVQKYPTVFFYSDGKVQHVLDGLISVKALKKEIRKLQVGWSEEE